MTHSNNSTRESFNKFKVTKYSEVSCLVSSFEIHDLGNFFRQLRHHQQLIQLQLQRDAGREGILDEDNRRWGTTYESGTGQCVTGWLNGLNWSKIAIINKLKNAIVMENIQGSLLANRSIPCHHVESKPQIDGEIDRRAIKRVFQHHKNRRTALRVAPK